MAELIETFPMWARRAGIVGYRFSRRFHEPIPIDTILRRRERGRPLPWDRATSTKTKGRGGPGA